MPKLNIRKNACKTKYQYNFSCTATKFVTSVRNTSYTHGLNCNLFGPIPMNKKLALPAIAMFAVMMGMAAFAPAFAAGSNGQKTTICHFQEEEIILDEFDQPIEVIPAEWVAITVNDRSLPAHLGDEENHEGHGFGENSDEVILNVDQPEGTITPEACVALPVPEPTEI